MTVNISPPVHSDAGRSISVHLGEAECPVTTSWDAPRELTRWTDGRRVFFLTEENVSRHHLDRFARVLPDAVTLIVPPGENSKTLKGAETIYRTLLENRIDRGDLLVALGGGMVTDLGAFVAATYKRGMDFVLVSTSLLGCVDAAVGGKAAVNLDDAKNAVGCFTVPQGVVLDVPALATLPTDQVREGLIEAYKTGLIGTPILAGLIEDQLDALLDKDLPLLSRVVELSVRTKADVVAEDFRESDRRVVLNLGHTYGHAVEGFHQYRISHGQSVAVGTIVAAAISRQRNMISSDLYETILATTRRIMPNEAQWPPLDQAWDIMKNDKKIRQGRMIFVLLKGIGEPVVVDDVTREDLVLAIDLARS